MNKKAIIIGAGIAGLASALRLKKKGFEVEVFEANSHPGGKMNTLEINGYRFDTGPSLFTLPYLVDELFELYDENPRSFFNYTKKKTICNYFWEDNTRFSASANLKQFINEASEIFNTPKNDIEKYLKRSKQKYNLTSKIFLEKSLHKASTYLSFNTLKALVMTYKLDINQSLNQTNAHHFSNPKLIQLFNRYATYNGSSPYKTPGIMSMIPHLEMDLGTFLPRGGMKSIANSLYEFSLTKGVKYHFNEEVKKIVTKNNKVSSIVTSKNTYKTDILVSNSDVFTSYTNLLKDKLPPKKIIHQERSSSAIIFYWGVNKTFAELDLHNILFSDDYEKEFNQIFNDKSTPLDPTIYINITSKDLPNDAPLGSENWFVMINTSANFGQNWDQLIIDARKHIISKINRILKINIEKHIVCEQILEPRTIESNTKSHRGSLYGASSNSKFSAFLRHPNFSSKIKGLYFCGGSVHPGGGIPLCLLSAKIVSEMISNNN